jgi:hypothetical protein
VKRTMVVLKFDIQQESYHSMLAIIPFRIAE